MIGKHRDTGLNKPLMRWIAIDGSMWRNHDNTAVTREEYGLHPIRVIPWEYK